MHFDIILVVLDISNVQGINCVALGEDQLTIYLLMSSYKETFSYLTSQPEKSERFSLGERRMAFFSPN